MRHTLAHFRTLRERGEKIVMLTCYDASFAATCDAAGVEILLVGDSLGMVIQGRDDTLAVSMDAITYHTSCVARGSKQALIVADMPFGSYQQSPQQAFANAARLLAAGAQAVKVEGGVTMLETIRFLTERGIPVCGHVGLTPQSVNQLGGYKVQGRTDAGAARMLEDAHAVESAGAAMVVVEAVPSGLASELTRAVGIPTIGIGANAECSGQVLVIYDLLDIYPGHKARFVKNFMEGAPSIKAAIERYVAAVKDKSFPAAEHTFK
jgi:3-methyl-2-oxobutanoate hydroxymethyltransferase